MYKNCKTQSSAQRMHNIADCLLSMMAQSPYDQITVTALCQTAGIPRKGFYRYFDTKEDVFNLIVDRIITECADYCSLGMNSPIEVTPHRLELCFEFWRSHRSFLDCIDRSNLQAAVMMRTFHFNHIIPDTVSASDQQLKTLFTTTGIFTIMMHWHSSGYDRTPEQIAQLTMSLLSVPLLNQ